MSANCPFHWNENKRPSQAASDPKFTYGAAGGKTMSHISSASVQKITERTGRNPGSIPGISASGDRLIAAGQDRRAARSKR